VSSKTLQNYRKEFFRVPLQNIKEEIEKSGINAKWTMIAEATQYYETLVIEKEIENNPASREAWLNRQLVIEQQRYSMPELNMII
jgi:hypothetical protein